MTSAWLWIAALVGGIAATFASAALHQPSLNLTLTAIVGFGFAALAARDRSQLAAAGASAPLLSSAAARSMAVVWGWTAASLVLIYVFALSWHEWWQYVIAAGGAAALCFYFAAMMKRDADSGRRDEAMLNLARYLTIGQLAGMIVAMVGLILDDKMPRDPSKPDWAASAIFFFGAASLAVISLNALRGSSSAQQS